MFGEGRKSINNNPRQLRRALLRQLRLKTRYSTKNGPFGVLEATVGGAGMGGVAAGALASAGVLSVCLLFKGSTWMFREGGREFSSVSTVRATAPASPWIKLMGVCTSAQLERLKEISARERKTKMGFICST